MNSCWRSHLIKVFAQGRRAPSPIEQEAAGGRRECRPYTANSTLAGNGIAVQGIACRDGDGQWRLVSEVPLR